MRISWKPLLRYLMLLFAGYGLLLWLFWLPAVSRAGGKAFHGFTMPFVEKSFSAYTFFSKPPEASPFYNYKIRFITTEELERQKNLAAGQSKMSLAGGTTLELKYHQVFFNPWFFLLCLILVTPLAWKRKLLAMLSGTFLLWLFAFLKIHLIIRQQFGGQSAGSSKGFFDHLVDVLVSPGFVGFLVIAIWLLAAFRKSNWQELVRRSE